jgi:hypothetical protein
MNEVILNKPNWLGSEVGLTLKTCTIPADFATTVIKNGRTIVESGTIFSDAATGQKGLVFGDYDITDGAVIGSIMIGGRYIDDKLPATAASVANDFIAQGLYACSESAAVRPDFGSTGIEQLATPVLTNDAGNSKVTWVAIAGALRYDVRVDGVIVDSVLPSETLEFSYADITGSITVQAIGDNLYYTDSDESTPVVIEAGDGN